MKAALPIFMGMTYSMGSAIMAAIYIILLGGLVDAIKWVIDVRKEAA